MLEKIVKKLSWLPQNKPRLRQIDEVVSKSTFSNYIDASNFQDVYLDSFQIRDAVDLTAELCVKAPLQMHWRNEVIPEAEEEFLLSIEELGGGNLIAFMARHMLVDGAFAAEIVRDLMGLPYNLVKLRTEDLLLDVDEHELAGFTYKSKSRKEVTYERSEVFYSPRGAFGKQWLGISALASLGSTLDDIVSLNEDLTTVSAKMWKRTFIYNIDDSKLTEDEADELFTYVLGLEPGKSIAVNQGIEANEIKVGGDLKSIQDALTAKKSEVAENFGLPRVLWNSGKSSDIGTLRPALTLFYDTKVRSLQRVIAWEITERLLKPYLEANKLPEARIYFADISLNEFPERVNAVGILVEKGIVDDIEAREMLGLRK